MATTPRREEIQVLPFSLMIVVDETGHEEFSDPRHPVFGFGGCAMLSVLLDQEIRTPLRAMKAAHFGGADIPLHAASLRSPTAEQLGALSDFFQNGHFVRFGVVIHNLAKIPSGVTPYLTQ
jgi:hypothetical protein